jgi:Ca2+-binding RTX toxin-like protein
MATTIGNLITLDGQFADWPSSGSIMTPSNTVSGYQIYGALINDASLGKTYVIGVSATVSSDPVISANTYIYLNTDQNTSTGFTPFGNVGAEYYVKFSLDANSALQPYLYSVTPAGVETLLNGGAPLSFGVSGNGESIEIAIPQTLLTPSGGAAPTSIEFSALVNGSVGLPGDFSTNPQYKITDPATLTPVDNSIKKIGIVYSATSAALYFGGGEAGKTAYSDLFMAAQHQAAAAGVSYDLLTEADLTNVAKLSQYSALVFPSMENVNSADASAIAASLHQIVYDYHVPLITAGNFMTNDQSGAPLAGNAYANMHELLNVTLGGYGTATYSVTPDAAALASQNPVMAGYHSGELIGGASGLFAGTTPGYYTNSGYMTFAGLTQPATVLADINIEGGGTVAGVIQTTTGGTNTVFATAGLLGDSNLLQHAIRNAVFGTAPSLAIDITRMAGVVDSRTDMDQSQFPQDVSPAGGHGIYDALIPILQTWKQQYNFVGSYYITVGDNANPDIENTTNWTISAPYYRAIIAMGGEIGTHSYTHLVNPPAVDANGNPIPLNGLGDSTWGENANTLYVTPPANGSAPNWTFNYEFGQAKTIIQQNLGITIAGAAVPGASETVGTSQNIMQYFQSAPGGPTGYVTGGWTGVGAGYPNAFGYMTPSDTGSVYIAPNITFDFTEIQYLKKTPEQALADWRAQFDSLAAHSETPVIVWPWHDYGPTNWDTDGTGSGPGYTTDMFTGFISYAFNAGYEFVTTEDLASRIAAQQKATISETTNGNVITATVTADPTAPDLGSMALNVVNAAAGQVIQNAGSHYAYDSDSVFLTYGGGSFSVTLGTTQDDVTHINALPMRADLLSVTGDGANLSFSMKGDGVVGAHVKTPGANVVSIQGAPAASLVGNDLSLTFNDGLLAISANSPQGLLVQHDVVISNGAVAVTTAGDDFVFGGSGNDLVNGLAGNDLLRGGGGNDTLNGGAGTNTVVYSGKTSDYSFTSNADGSVTIADVRNGSPDGTDTDIGIQSYRFGDGVVLAQNLLPFATITGSIGNDVMIGSAIPHSGQTILGLDGADTLTAGTGGNTTLDGGAGGDTLKDAGAAASAAIVDTLIGGLGNDTYMVTRSNDIVVEQLNGGTDTVRTTLSTYLLSSNVENLVFTGSGAFTSTATGNSQAITGGVAGDTLGDGGFSNVVLRGNGGADTFIVNNALTTVNEVAGSTNSTVSTTLGAYTLGGTVQNLTYIGAGTFTGNGNALANTVTGGQGSDTLYGNGGLDTLIGGAGKDTLSGGSGADTFVFAPVNPSTTNGYSAGFGKDVITDFTASMTNTSHDVLNLASSMFAPGTTAAALFNGTAHNAGGGLVSVVQSGTSVVMSIDQNDTITLNNVLLSVLKSSAAADIHFF